MLALPLTGAARAAELDGVALPDTRQADGVTLRLNGIGLRTYSVFRIHIYVAGLYLEQPGHDGEAVLDSDQVKLMEIRFVHDVDVDNARKAWIEGFDGNCVAPCHLPAAEVQRFLDAVPPFRRGDGSLLLFATARCGSGSTASRSAPSPTRCLPAPSWPPSSARRRRPTG